MILLLMCEFCGIFFCEQLLRCAKNRQMLPETDKIYCLYAFMLWTS